MTETQTTFTTFTAYATGADQAARLGCDAETVLVQAFEDAGEGSSIYTGEDIELAGATTEADDMDAVLAANGWRRIGAWDTTSGQHIARVERIAR